MYREYMIVGNRDFKLNIAALAELMSKYLANHSEILEDEDKYIQVLQAHKYHQAWNCT